MPSKTLLAAGALVLTALAATPATAHTAYEIKHMLRDWGFNRIEIIDAELPKYQFAACQRSDRYHLHADYYGVITEKYRIGSCGGEREYDGRRRYNRYQDGYRY